MTASDYLPPPNIGEAYEGMTLPEELRFMADFAVESGDAAAAMRLHAISTKKLDRTDVTDWDKKIERDFREAVHARSDGRDSVIGEEEESAPLTGVGNEWIIDPIDGTGEYIRDHKENGEPLEDSERTTCVGIAQFKDGRLVRSVVYNPFRNELFVADDELGGVFLNGRRLQLANGEAGNMPFGQGIPYDYAYWDGAAIDPRFFEQTIGGEPRGSYSAIYQACEVAAGRSAFAVFSGNTIHDIAPAAKLVSMEGTVSDPSGQPLDWQNLNGAVYSNGIVHADVISELEARVA